MLSVMIQFIFLLVANWTQNAIIKCSKIYSQLKGFVYTLVVLFRESCVDTGNTRAMYLFFLYDGEERRSRMWQDWKILYYTDILIVEGLKQPKFLLIPFSLTEVVLHWMCGLSFYGKMKNFAGVLFIVNYNNYTA